MDVVENELIAESFFAWDDGRRAEALDLMKTAVRIDPSMLDVRRALAERYRQMNLPDQAGRWGIVFENWTTRVEQDRLARLLAASGVRESDVAHFLDLPSDTLPDVVRVLLLGPVETYRTRFQVKRAERAYGGTPDGTAASEYLIGPTFVAWGLFVLTGVIGVSVIFVFLINGMATPVAARILTLVCIGPLAFALACSAALAASWKSIAWAATWLLLCAGVVVFLLHQQYSGWIYGAAA